MKKMNINLIPSVENPTPDYYCTWQTQLYATSDGKPEGQRAIIDENSLFSKEKPYGWAYFFENARKDLFLVMDDSWDVPINGDKSYFGSLILSKEKFPNATDNTENNAEALKKLTDLVKKLGWKGLGGWVCAQEAPLFSENIETKEYWKKRFLEADESGFSYWKVDWGEKSANYEFRTFLNDMAKKYAPNLTVEQALVKETIPVSDVFRTYDVPALMSIPMTMNKLADVLKSGVTKTGCSGLVNSEDEVYMAAAGGFSMGVMRHPYVGAFPNGKPDMSFPALHRNIKTKMTEVTRAARFHRIAPAFGVDAENTIICDNILTDSWRFRDYDSEIEAWWFNTGFFRDRVVNDLIEMTAPAAISRNCPMPEIKPDKNGNVPFLIASRNPNGVFSLATLGRTNEREYFIPRCDVTAEIGDSDTIGVFGDYNTLTLKSERSEFDKIFAQDLAGESAFDITEDVKVYDNTLIISGDILRKIGTQAQPDDDTSEPGLIIKIVFNNRKKGIEKQEKVW